MADGRLGERGKPAVLDRIGLRVRPGVWLSTVGLFLVAVYPWSAEFNDPEGSWIPGPLWLFIGTSVWDKIIGLVVAAVLAPSIFAILLKPG